MPPPTTVVATLGKKLSKQETSAFYKIDKYDECRSAKLKLNCTHLPFKDYGSFLKTPESRRAVAAVPLNGITWPPEVQRSLAAVGMDITKEVIISCDWVVNNPAPPILSEGADAEIIRTAIGNKKPEHALGTARPGYDLPPAVLPQPVVKSWKNKWDIGGKREKEARAAAEKETERRNELYRAVVDKVVLRANVIGAIRIKKDVEKNLDVSRYRGVSRLEDYAPYNLWLNEIAKYKIHVDEPYRTNRAEWCEIAQIGTRGSDVYAVCNDYHIDRDTMHFQAVRLEGDKFVGLSAADMLNICQSSNNNSKSNSKPLAQSQSQSGGDGESPANPTQPNAKTNTKTMTRAQAVDYFIEYMSRYSVGDNGRPNPAYTFTHYRDTYHTTYDYIGREGQEIKKILADPKRQERGDSHRLFEGAMDIFVTKVTPAMALQAVKGTADPVQLYDAIRRCDDFMSLVVKENITRYFELNWTEMREKNRQRKIGPKTKSAVMEFQKKHNLKADGVVGQKTWSEMKQFIAE